MRVDRTLGHELPAQLGGPRPQDRKSAPAGQAEASASGSAEVVSSAQRYVALAARADSVDKAAVEEARKLLASGQLDSEESVLRLAEKLASLGI